MVLEKTLAAAAAKSLQSCPTLCDPIDGSPPGTRLPCSWDSPGKNTGVGCHVLLQCMKVKSESEVSQSCPTFSDPLDCSLPGSSIHEIFQARVLEWGAIAFSEEDFLVSPGQGDLGLSGAELGRNTQCLPLRINLMFEPWKEDIKTGEDRASLAAQ